MSKCVLYEPSVRVPLVVRPPGGCEPVTVGDLVEHVDVPATLRELAGGPDVAHSEGRSLAAYFRGEPPDRRTVTVSENWGFACFETERYKLVVDEDALSPCQLFDLCEDPHEDADILHEPSARDVVEGIMEAHVRPFLATPPARPHASIFTG